MSSLYGHRNVIRMEGILQTASRFYVVMELASVCRTHYTTLRDMQSGVLNNAFFGKKNKKPKQCSENQSFFFKH